MNKPTSVSSVDRKEALHSDQVGQERETPGAIFTGERTDRSCREWGDNRAMEMTRKSWSEDEEDCLNIFANWKKKNRKTEPIALEIGGKEKACVVWWEYCWQTTQVHKRRGWRLPLYSWVHLHNY